MRRVEFGTDGIRGIVGEWPWQKPIIMRIGQALGEYIHARSLQPFVVMGFDTRHSSEGFMNDLCTGMIGQGVDVINLGIMTTPGVAFLTRRVSAALGIIVSASHSPLDYNGIKLVDTNGLRLSREDEIEIEFLIERSITTDVSLRSELGKEIDGHHLWEIYVDDHTKLFTAEYLQGFRVVLDCAHGAAHSLGPEVFKRIGCQVKVVHNSPDGKNINHHSGSEFAREHPDELAKVIHEWDAEYGFAFDGDGDRLVVVDRTGKIYDGQDLLYVLGVHFFKKESLRNNTIVTTRLSNQGFEDSVKKLGVQVVYANKGDRHLEAAMWGGNYLLGGEIGGNIIINDGNHTSADAIFTALVLADLLARNKETSLREMSIPLKKYPHKIMSFPTIGGLSQSQRVDLERKIYPLVSQLGPGGRILIWESSTEHQIFRILIEGGPLCGMEEFAGVSSTVQHIIEKVFDLDNSRAD